MALVVEDGSVVAGADSYETLANYQAYVVAIGKAASGTDATDESNLRRSFQILNRKGWRGTRETDGQAGAWPRYGVGKVYGWNVPSATIPQDIKDAQCEIAYLLQEGLDPLATVEGGAIKSAKAGPVETEFATFRETPRLVAVEGLIAPYLQSGSGQVRVQRG